MAAGGDRMGPGLASVLWRRLVLIRRGECGAAIQGYGDSIEWRERRVCVRRGFRRAHTEPETARRIATAVRARSWR